MRAARAAIGAAFRALALVGCSCGEATEQARPQVTAPAGPLPTGVVARVGSIEITAEAAALVARARKCSPREAAHALVRDALLAEGAKASGLGATGDARAELAALHASLVLDDLEAQAVARGPVSDDELAKVTEKHWLDLDRPAAFRTLHAVVRYETCPAGASKGGKPCAETTPERKEVARRLAGDLRRLAEALPRDLDRPSGAPDGADPFTPKFKAAVAEVDANGLEVLTEELPPVTADGRIARPGGGNFDADFAAAAAKLSARGEVSPVTETRFGAHVIVLLERLPERRPSEAERRALVRDEVMTDRARELHRALLGPLRERAQVERSADSLLALVRIEANAVGAAPASPPPARP